MKMGKNLHLKTIRDIKTKNSLKEAVLQYKSARTSDRLTLGEIAAISNTIIHTAKTMGITVDELNEMALSENEGFQCRDCNEYMGKRASNHKYCERCLSNWYAENNLDPSEVPNGDYDEMVRHEE